MFDAIAGAVLRYAEDALQSVIAGFKQQQNTIEEQALAPVNAIIQSVEQGVPWRGEGAQKFLEELSTLLVPDFGSVLGEVVGFQANLQQAAEIMHEADSGAQKIVAGLES